MKRPSAVMVLVGVCVAGLIALLVYGVVSQDADRSVDETIARGERVPAPDIELPPLGGGEERSLEDWRGKVVLLNYWASWCEPCRAESPLLERWHKRIVKRGGTVLGVNVLDVTSDATDFIDEYELTYPHLRDEDGETQEELGLVAYPETFVIDRAGRIVAVQRGPVKEKFLRATVPPLLRED